MTNRLIHIADNERDIGDVVGCCARAIGKLCARQYVVAIDGVLQYNFAPCVKVQNAPVHTSYVERQQAAPIRKCSRKIERFCHESGANLSQILQQRSNRVVLTAGLKILIERGLT